ncbi:MAG TPA: DUF4178 domain-containing protein [Candidatus Angelobacter sp.]|nr:DUF4178 domain-containing protein [Candidatus Angelobacter sp.]
MPESSPGKEIPAVSVRSLSCPNCGAAVIVRSFGQAVTVVCGSCQSILDAQDPKVAILQRFQSAIKYEPLIPLGSRGKLRGTLYEVVGCQRRSIEVEGFTYSWSEYILFNPYKGFRYLTEYDGHWNYVSILRTLPDARGGAGSEAPVKYLGESYRHFQTAEAKTTFVLGEFPWQVRVDETVDVTDYVSPPRVLSAEISKDKEVTWSLGEYMNGADIWKAFSAPRQPPPAIGVYENQPSPFSSNARAVWKYCALFFCLAVLLFIANGIRAKDQLIFSRSYVFNAASPGEHSFVTDGFELTGHPAALEVKTETNVNNSWIYLNYTLINQDTGQAWDFGREVSYYYGYDSDGSWSEGKAEDTAVVPTVPPGNYYLRIEPESDPRYTTSYVVTVRHDVVVGWWFPITAGLLILPAAFATWRSISFEHMRWQESDHASSSMLTSAGSGDSGDSDDS